MGPENTLFDMRELMESIQSFNSMAEIAVYSFVFFLTATAVFLLIGHAFIQGVDGARGFHGTITASAIYEKFANFLTQKGRTRKSPRIEGTVSLPSVPRSAFRSLISVQNNPTISPGAHPVATVQDGKKFKQFIDSWDPKKNDDWEQIVDKTFGSGRTPNSYRAWRAWRDPEKTGTDYVSSTILPTTPAWVVHQFFLDDAFRSKWDSTFEDYKIAHFDHTTGSEVVYWKRKLPLFFSDRDYLFTRRSFVFSETTSKKSKNSPENFDSKASIYTVSFACDFRVSESKSGDYDYLRNSKVKRVNGFSSSWLIRPIENGAGCETLLLHFEDLGFNQELCRMTIKKMMWIQVQGMLKGIASYRFHALLALNSPFSINNSDPFISTPGLSRGLPEISDKKGEANNFSNKFFSEEKNLKAANTSDQAYSDLLSGSDVTEFMTRNSAENTRNFRLSISEAPESFQVSQENSGVNVAENEIMRSRENKGGKSKKNIVAKSIFFGVSTLFIPGIPLGVKVSSGLLTAYFSSRKGAKSSEPVPFIG